MNIRHIVTIDIKMGRMIHNGYNGNRNHTLYRENRIDSNILVPGWVSNRLDVGTSSVRDH